MTLPPKTDEVRAIEVMLGDWLVLHNLWMTGEPGEYEFMMVRQIALQGDDVVINDERLTTSMGNFLNILPRSVIARLAD